MQPMTHGDESVEANGDGWRALIRTTIIYVAVDPGAPGDPLVDAVFAILSPYRRPFWTVEPSHEDSDGWDVYLLQRIRPELVPV